MTSLCDDLSVGFCTTSNDVVEHNENEAYVEDEDSNECDPTEYVIVADLFAQHQWVVKHYLVDEILLTQTRYEEQQQNELQ